MKNAVRFNMTFLREQPVAVSMGADGLMTIEGFPYPSELSLTVKIAKLVMDYSRGKYDTEIEPERAE